MRNRTRGTIHDRRFRPPARPAPGPAREPRPTGDGDGELGGPGDYASRVLEVAETIPPGRVMSYGDIAEYLGEGGPRQVGRVMSLWGGGVAWWWVCARGRQLARPAMSTRR